MRMQVPLLLRNAGGGKIAVWTLPKRLRICVSARRTVAVEATIFGPCRRPLICLEARRRA